MSDTSKHGNKRKMAIAIMDANADKDFFEITNMISEAIGVDKYSARSYFKYIVKNGLSAKFEASSTPWKTAKEARKPAKEPKAAKTFEKKVSAKTVEAAADAASSDKPATAMIREFVKKQKAAKAA